MPRRGRLGAACLIGLIRGALGQIRVLAPRWLVEEFQSSQGRIDGTTATFGAPYYGDRILGRLVYGESKHNHSHCRDDDYEVPLPSEAETEESNDEEVRLINIVVVRRGACSFVRKVLVAQDQKGAHAVIIVDAEGSKLKSEDIRNIIMADDGYGNKVHIPSILIPSSEGARLIQAAKSSQVIVELAWDIPTDHIVTLDLWMNSASRETQRFLKEFAPKRRQLNHYVRFIPHFAVFSMSNAMDYNELCTDVRAEFCAEDPDGAGRVTGAMVLAEDLRQLCIHELTLVHASGRAEDIDPHHPAAYADKFWTYVERFGERCPVDGATEDARFGEKCSLALMSEVGVDGQRVQDCVVRTKDSKLKFERDNRAWSPRAMRINGWRYMGELEADLVTRAICAGFVRQPDACGSLLEPRNPFKGYKLEKPSGLTFGSFLTALALFLAVTLGAMLLYKRALTNNIHAQLREEVTLEVQAQMDTYKQLPS